jgi:phosphoribosylformylglycinamidine (FGAM) synthase-like enzyme
MYPQGADRIAQLSSRQIEQILKQKSTAPLGQVQPGGAARPQAEEQISGVIGAGISQTMQASERLQVWFWDESGFSLQTIRRKQWGKQGQRKSVNSKRRQG